METMWKKCTKKPLTIEYREVVGHSEKITTVEGVEIWCYSNVHYIMRGTKGEMYPITKAIFNETYTTDEPPAPKPENPDVVQKRGWICECGHVQRDHIGFSKYCLVCSCKVFKKRAETPAPNLACVKCGGKVFYPLDGGFCCEKCGGMKPTPKPEPPENEDVLSDHYYTPASNDEYEKPVTKPTEFIGELVGGRPEFPGKPPGETPAPNPRMAKAPVYETNQGPNGLGSSDGDGGNAGDSLKPNELDRLGIQPGTLTEAEKLEKAKSFIDKVEGSRILHCRHCDYGTRRELELLIHLRKHGYSAPDQSDYWIEKTSDFQW